MEPPVSTRIDAGWDNGGMSTPMNGRGRSGVGSIPRGETVATVPTYEEAMAIVDTLARADFPVAQVTILGNDLKSVETVTGRMTYTKAALAGAATGAWFGLFLSLLFLVVPTEGADVGTMFAPILLGAGFGMIFGIVSFSIQRRRREFTSVTQVIASTYAVVVAPDSADAARRLLEGGSGFAPPSAPAAGTPEAGAPEAGAPADGEPGEVEGPERPTP